MKTVIFDIDGTLANIWHRLHHVTGGNKRWDEFFKAAKDDLPIVQMIELLNILRSSGIFIILVSGRSENIRGLTEEWLRENGVPPIYNLYMRPEGDYRKDFIIKKEILKLIHREFPSIDILFVVDDRPSVVKMWREEGLICLQCAEWEEAQKILPLKKGLLTLMVGPSGAGKSSWLDSQCAAYDPALFPSRVCYSQIISSDQLRLELCGNFRDQTKNSEVFTALRAVVKARIDNGIPAVVDATNIKRADRMSIVELAGEGDVRYTVLDRPLKDKLRDAGWRSEVPGLIEKHHQIFQSQLKDILSGDKLPNVKVLDLRAIK